LGTPIITSYAIGMDNTGLYYESACQDQDCSRLEQELDQLIRNSMAEDSRFFGKIHPYVTRAEPELVIALAEAAEHLGVSTRLGLTVSNPGFFAPQGRDTARLQPSVADLDEIFSEFDPSLDGQRVENMEMESSFLIHFLSGLGYWAGSICPTIANRRQNTFDPNYQESIKNATNIALQALANVRLRYPDGRLSANPLRR
jgi:uridine phosphorylase